MPSSFTTALTIRFNATVPSRSPAARNLSALSATLLAALLLAACTKGTSGSHPASAARTAVPAVPGTATLYVLNSGEPLFTISSNTVYDGQQELVRVSEGRYAIVLLYPGRHVLSCGGMPAAAPAILDAAPGQTYYLQTYLGSGRTKQICALLPPQIGERALAEIASEKPTTKAQPPSK